MPDISREELLKQGQEVADRGGLVWFKFTCSSCGDRCTLADVNTLYEYGECHCGAKTKIEQGGMLVMFPLSDKGAEALLKKVDDGQA